MFHVGCGLPVDGTLAFYGFHADKVWWLLCGSVMGRGKTFELVVVLTPCMDGAYIVFLVTYPHQSTMTSLEIRSANGSDTIQIWELPYLYPFLNADTNTDTGIIWIKKLHIHILKKRIRIGNG